MSTTAVSSGPETTGAAAFASISLDDLIESPKNPRKHYDEAALQSLADNLSSVGQITPIIVRPHPTRRGKYEIAAGHRRTRAARRAGLPALDAIVRPLDDAAMAEILNLENLKRDDLNPIEEAQGFRTLMEDAGYDIKRLASRVSLSERAVYDKLALLRLIPEAQDLIARTVLSPAHGALLSRLTTDDQRRALTTDDALMTVERVAAEHFPDQLVKVNGELDLQDTRKPRTVRELKQWIDDHVRFRPEQMAQADLAMDLPGTAELLATAAARKAKVLAITRDYRVGDDARDPAQRTYGTNGWRRADGAVEPYNEWGAPDPTASPSKICEYAQEAVVVAGPGRGDAFRVCVAKDRCQVHWADAIKRKAKEARTAKGAPGRTAAEQAAAEAAYEAREQEKKDQAKRRTQAHLAALREALAGMSLGTFAPNLRDTLAAVLLVNRPWRVELVLAEFFPGVTGHGQKLPTALAAVRKLPADDRLRLLATLCLASHVEVTAYSSPSTLFLDAMKQLGVDVTAHVKAATPAKAAKKPVKIAAKKAG